MLCSVIIPVYNCPQKILFQCISSFVELDNDLFEVIIIDDGSDDDVLSALKSFDSEIIKVIKQKNSGVSIARNRGIEAAKGDWIIFCDSDDAIIPKTLNYLVNVLVCEKSDFLYSNYLKSKHGRNSIVNLKECIDSRDFLKCVLCHPNIYGTVWGKVYRKSILMEGDIRFDAALTHAEDSIFLIKYLLKSKSIKKIEMFYQYKVNYYSSAKQNDRAMDNYIISMYECKNILDNFPKEKLYVSNFNCVNLMIMIVNYICLENTSFEDFEKKLKSVLGIDIVENSLKNYVKSEISTVYKIVLSLINIKAFRLIYILAAIRRKL